MCLVRDSEGSQGPMLQMQQGCRGRPIPCAPQSLQAAQHHPCPLPGPGAACRRESTGSGKPARHSAPSGGREMQTRTHETPPHGRQDSRTPTRNDKCWRGRGDVRTVHHTGGDVTRNSLFENSHAGPRKGAHGVAGRPCNSTAGYAADRHENARHTKPASGRPQWHHSQQPKGGDNPSVRHR